MFVADLDRPWLGLPFLLQGFLIEDEEQLAVLRTHCSVVQIDTARSAIAFTDSPAKETAAIRHAVAVAAPGAESRRPPTGFIEILQRVHDRQPFERPVHPPAINPVDGHSDISEEIIYSSTIVRDARDAVQLLMENVELTEKVNLDRVADFVEKIGQGVARNPDALIWLARLKNADNYTYDHAIDVSIHLMVFGSFVGLEQRSIVQLGLVGLLQDIGKVHLPPELLAKQTPLSQEELAVIRSHVASSLEMLTRQAKFDRQLISVVSRHHERHDGSGYPQSLRGERIGLMAEMAGLIDTYCAMTRQRPYGPPVSTQQAISSLVAMRGNKFREALIDEFVQCIGIYPVGSLVELNTGEVAVVVQKNQVRRLKPKLMILLAPDKTPERRPRMLDLMLDPPAPDGRPVQIVRSLPSNAFGIDPEAFYLS